MRGLMMDRPLLISQILEFAAVNFPDQEIVSRTTEGPMHRYTYPEMAARTRKLANALESLGACPKTGSAPLPGIPTGTWKFTTQAPAWVRFVTP